MNSFFAHIYRERASVCTSYEVMTIVLCLLMLDASVLLSCCGWLERRIKARTKVKRLLRITFAEHTHNHSRLKCLRLAWAAVEYARKPHSPTSGDHKRSKRRRERRPTRKKTHTHTSTNEKLVQVFRLCVNSCAAENVRRADINENKMLFM